MARDYKDEYDKFQKDRSAYRAKLNKYNRDKGTYGNDDNLDATHKMERFLDLHNLAKTKAKRRKVV